MKAVEEHIHADGERGAFSGEFRGMPQAACDWLNHLLSGMGSVVVVVQTVLSFDPDPGGGPPPSACVPVSLPSAGHLPHISAIACSRRAVLHQR